MAELNIDTQVIAPKRVNVRLVYAEDLFVSNVFRVLFDVCLALEMAVAGAALSSSVPATADRKILLWVLGGLAVIFLGLNLFFMVRSRRSG